MEQIITNMNLLNRSIEGVIAVPNFLFTLCILILMQVGKEFESVSTLWRSFHEVLAKGEVSPEGNTDEGEEQ
jgi:DASH complex subunit DAD1